MMLDNRSFFSYMLKFRALFHLIFVEIVGLVIALYLSLPIKAIILGSLVIIIISLWNLIMEIYGGHKHLDMGDVSSPLEQKIINHYQRSLFKRYELLISLLIVGLLLSYINLFSNTLISRSFDYHLNPVLTLLIGILVWGVSYWIGIHLRVSIISLIRSLKLLRASKVRDRLEYTSYKKVNKLKNFESLNIFPLTGVIPLLPLITRDMALVGFIIAYTLSILGMSFYSLIVLSKIPIYPPDVLWLLEESMFAYIGTSNTHRQSHVTPVIFVFDGKAPYVVTSKTAKKAKNLKENNKLSLLIDVRDRNDLMNNRAVLIKGKGKIFSRSDIIFNLLPLLKIRQLFYRKYPHYMRKYSQDQDKLPINWRTSIITSRLIIRIDMEEFDYWKRATRIYVSV